MPWRLARPSRPRWFAPTQRKSQAKKAARLQREDKDRRRKAERERKAAALARKVRKAEGAGDEEEDDTMTSVTFGRPAAVEETAAAAQDDDDVFDDSDDELYAASRLLARKAAAKVSLAVPPVAWPQALRPGGWPLVAPPLPASCASAGCNAPLALPPCPRVLATRSAELEQGQRVRAWAAWSWAGGGLAACGTKVSDAAVAAFADSGEEPHPAGWRLGRARVWAGPDWAGRCGRAPDALHGLVTRGHHDDCVAAEHTSQNKLASTLCVSRTGGPTSHGPTRKAMSLLRLHRRGCSSGQPHCSSCSSAPARSSRHNLYS